VVLGGNPKIDNYIDQATRFKASGYEHAEPYKKGEWDGFTRLYNNTEKIFPLGLLETVEMMLILKDIKYETIDNRVYRQFDQLPITHEIQLRDYQQLALDKAIEKQRCLLQLPTGSGKTLIGVCLTGDLKLPTVFYVHKKELLYQTLRTYRRTLTFPQCKECPKASKKKTGDCDWKKCMVGIVGDGQVDLKPITIAMVQSANRLHKSLFTEFGIVIFDETHHLSSDTYYDIAKDTKSRYLIGLSATIRREDGKELMLQAGAGPVSYNLSISELIRRKYLAKPHIHAIPVAPVMFSNRDNYHKVYEKAIVYNTERNDKIILKALELCDTGPVYIHVKRIDHGEILVNLINHKLLAKGLTKAVFIDGKDKSEYRNEILDKFRHNELPILISTLLGEGVDLPNMYGLILASGGLSRTQTIQVFGRLLRISEHDIVVFVDVADRCKYLYEHFLARVNFYQSEPEFELEDYIKKLKTE
jgi:superfamily II DNA or RNA helicase